MLEEKTGFSEVDEYIKDELIPLRIKKEYSN